MEIEIVSLQDIKPYEKNAKKHPKKQIQQIIESIQEFGNNDPIAIDENNVIIEGHGRYEALKELGFSNVECIRLGHLSEEQKKAYILIHNKLTMNSGFELDILNDELDSIFNIDMESFGFKVDSFDDLDKEFGEERRRTGDAYNLCDFDNSRCAGFYEFPVLDPIDYIPEELLGFNYMLNSDKKDCCLHFFIDDYQFERVWNQPYFYIQKMREYDSCLTPDFSLYMNMPMSMKIWNIYRSKLIGQMCQDAGMKVIPTLQWAEKETLEWCFDGLPQNSTVAVSTIGVKTDKSSTKVWYDGMARAMEVLKPKNILVYGGDIGYDFGKANVKYYSNQVTDRMKASKK